MWVVLRLTLFFAAGCTDAFNVARRSLRNKILRESAPWVKLVEKAESAGALLHGRRGSSTSQGPPIDYYELPPTPCGNLLNRCDPGLPLVQDGEECLSALHLHSDRRAACCRSPGSECVLDISTNYGAHCTPHSEIARASSERDNVVRYATFTRPRPDDGIRDEASVGSESGVELTLEDLVDEVFFITMPQRRGSVDRFIEEMALEHATIIDAVHPEELPPQDELVKMGLSCAGKQGKDDGVPSCRYELQELVQKNYGKPNSAIESANEAHLKILSSVHFSHRKAIQAVANLGGERWGLIFEDDIAVPPMGAVERLRAFMRSAPSDMDMALPSFCYESFDSRRVLVGADGESDIYRSMSPLCGTAYMLTARAAQRVLDMKVVNPIIDWQLIREPVMSNTVTAYAPLCPIFDQIHSGESDEPSSLSGHDNRYPTWKRGSFVAEASARAKMWSLFKRSGTNFIGSDPVLRAQSLLRQPTFFVIGMPKCGTTSVHAALAALPSVQIAAPVSPDEPRYANKEVHFFDTPHFYRRGLNWYRLHFPRAAGDLTPPHQLLDATPNYFANDVNAAVSGAPIAARIAAAYGGMNSEAFRNLRFVVMLRDPVTRMASEWAHFVSAGYLNSTTGSFLGDVEIDLGSSGNACDYFDRGSERPGCATSISVNFYARTFRRWLRSGVRAEQICVAFTNELESKDAWAQAIRRIKRCVGLGSVQGQNALVHESPPKKNQASKQPWSSSSAEAEVEANSDTSPTSKRLKDLYHSWDCALGDLLAAHPGFGFSRHELSELSGGWIPNLEWCESSSAG